MLQRVLRPILIAAGTCAVAIGIVGIFVPLLPTTPFLLLAAACFARSSPRMLRWMHGNRWFGAHIRNYRAGLGIPRREKLIAIAVIWITMGGALTFFVDTLWVKLLLGAIALAVTAHLLRIRTFDPKAMHDAGCEEASR